MSPRIRWTRALQPPRPSHHPRAGRGEQIGPPIFKARRGQHGRVTSGSAQPESGRRHPEPGQGHSARHRSKYFDRMVHVAIAIQRWGSTWAENCHLLHRAPWCRSHGPPVRAPPGSESNGRDPPEFHVTVAVVQSPRSGCAEPLGPVFFPRGGKKDCAKVFRVATGRAPKEQQGLKCSNQMVPWGQSPPGQEAATGSGPGYEQHGGNKQRSARVSMFRHAFGCVRRDSGDAPPMILQWPLACRSCWVPPCSAPPATYVCPGPGCVEQKVAVL